MLYKLIRELSVTPDLVFCPERAATGSEVENLIRRLYNSEKRTLEVVKATAIVLIETAAKSDKADK